MILLFSVTLPVIQLVLQKNLQLTKFLVMRKSRNIWISPSLPDLGTPTKKSKQNWKHLKGKAHDPLHGRVVEKRHKFLGFLMVLIITA
jgi:hypothetical protein